MSKELKEGSQESRASNGARFGVETKKLWPFEDERAKLRGNFAAEESFRRVFRSCETTLWHTTAISQPRTLISQLQNGFKISMPQNPSARTPWTDMSQPHPCWTHFKVIPEVHFMHTISHFKSWEVSSPELQAVLDLEVKRRSYGRLKMTVQSWTEMLQPHPI